MNCSLPFRLLRVFAGAALLVAGPFADRACDAAPPVARRDQVLIPSSWSSPTNHEPLVIEVLANDSDPEGDPLTVVSATGARHGALTHDGARITYSPHRDVVRGSILAARLADWFTYQVSDGQGGTSTGYVALATSAPPAVGPFCLPERYEARMRRFDPINNHVIERSLTFDLAENALREWAVEWNPNESPTEIFRLFRPADGFLYERRAGEACSRFELATSFTPTCFDPATTPFLGEERLGRQVVTRWLLPEAAGRHLVYTIADAGPAMIPVAVERYLGTTLEVRAVFLDFIRRTTPFPAGTFIPPADCVP